MRFADFSTFLLKRKSTFDCFSGCYPRLNM